MQFDEFEAVASERIREVLNGGDFQDVSELEDALIEIRTTQEEIDHVKALKKRRAAVYDEQIKAAEAKETILREAIERCMKTSKKKTLKYPGVGSVSRRNVKGKWVIEDEDALVKHCEDLGIGDDAYEETIKINKTKMNKVLDELDKNSNLPDGVKREDDRESLTVSVEKPKVEEESPAPTAEPKAVFGSGVAEEELDKLEI